MIDHSGTAKDAFGVELLSGELYLGLFPTYTDAKSVADRLGKPTSIVRYSVPTRKDGSYCDDCLNLIKLKHTLKPTVCRHPGEDE